MPTLSRTPLESYPECVESAAQGFCNNAHENRGESNKKSEQFVRLGEKRKERKGRKKVTFRKCPRKENFHLRRRRQLFFAARRSLNKGENCPKEMKAKKFVRRSNDVLSKTELPQRLLKRILRLWLLLLLWKLLLLLLWLLRFGLAKVASGKLIPIPSLL